MTPFWSKVIAFGEKFSEPSSWPISYRRTFVMTLPVSWPLWLIGRTLHVILSVVAIAVLTSTLRVIELWEAPDRADQ